MTGNVFNLPQIVQNVDSLPFFKLLRVTFTLQYSYKNLSNKIKNMQRLFYVVCRWLEEDSSKQAERIGTMIKADMETIGFGYDEIANN